MNEMKFKAAFGNEVKTVELSKPFGGGGSYFISIDHFHSGKLIKYGSEWKAVLNGDGFTMGDADALAEIIEIAETQKSPD